MRTCSRKHNEANGEENRDGIDDNRSWNCGVEGPSDDPAIEKLRTRRAKNFLAVTVLSAGMPMLLMGDEPLVFELPKAPGGSPWHRWIDAFLDSPDDITDWMQAPLVADHDLSRGGGLRRRTDRGPRTSASGGHGHCIAPVQTPGVDPVAGRQGRCSVRFQCSATVSAAGVSSSAPRSA